MTQKETITVSRIDAPTCQYSLKTLRKLDLSLPL